MQAPRSRHASRRLSSAAAGDLVRFAFTGPAAPTLEVELELRP